MSSDGTILVPQDNSAKISSAHAKPANNEGVITSRADQEAYLRAANRGGQLPAEFTNVAARGDAHDRHGATVEKAQTPGGAQVQDLVYRYQVDPLVEGMGSIISNFDSITSKMSRLLNDKSINEKHEIKFSDLQELAKHPEFANQFTKSELKSISLLRSYGPQAGAFGHFGEKPLSRKDVMDFGRQLGLLKDA